MRLFLTCNLFCVLITVSACALLGGSGTPDVPRAKGYHNPIPARWKETSSEGESDKAYRTPEGNIATLTSTCTQDAKFNPEILTKQLLMGARKIKYQEKKKITVDSREGQFSDVKSTLDGKPFHLLIFVLPKNDCVFDFTLVGNKPFEAIEREEFNSFFMGFKHGTN